MIKKIPQIGNEMQQLMKRLYPICRSITGNGVRQTLQIISEFIPLEIYEVPSGTNVFDWTIPKEWNINDAYIIGPNGKKIIDFQNSNLHVVSYSTPIHEKISLNDLKKNIHTLPSQPDVIPYLTSYYDENWGFCMKHNDFLKLKNGTYEVFIDSSLKEGNLTYGELYLKGKKEDEIVLSCYVCHPSLCNDSLSGVVLTTTLAKYLSKLENNFSFRFLFIPETIGAITWLSRNENNVSKIKHGLVVTCVGDPGKSTYKRSREGNYPIDFVVEKALKEFGEPYEILDFFPTGSDERQFCSPGFNLPFGSLMRTPYDRYPEYHTSADDLNFVKPEWLENSFLKYISIISKLEENEFNEYGNKDQHQNLNKVKSNNNIPIFLNLFPKCEPQLGKRGLYQKIGGMKNAKHNKLAMLWVLNQSDGKHTLAEIAEKSKIEYQVLHKTAKLLQEHDLLAQIN